MTHWLVRGAERAGIRGVGGIQLRPQATITEAWEAVGRIAGLSSGELATRIGAALRIPVANIEASDRRSIRLVPERVARQFNVLPIREDDRTIVVATADPNNLDAEKAIEFAAGRRVTLALAAPEAITREINARYSPNLVIDTVLSAVREDTMNLVKVVDDQQADQVAAIDVEAEPVVRLINVILRDAIVHDASDVHIEPGPGAGAVRFRIDGLLRLHLQLPMSVITRLVSRVKVISKLDIADRFRPQDGRARIQVDGRNFDLRVSTVPSREAEKAVIRILRPMPDLTLDNMGLPEPELAKLRRLLTFRDGIVIITGPTGSGKTTTIYGAIREIARGDVNLVTVEDPVEYEIPGITQIQVEVKRNVTFASALRSILRQDPDVIFVGEVRDLETAEIAVQAALTGHLVLATVHANTAMGAVGRLADLGLDSASIASTLRGSIAQRLLRRLCGRCALPVGPELTEDEERLAALYATPPVRRAVGCPECANTGYRGRVPVAEVAIVSTELGELIAGGAALPTLTRLALSQGMRDLRDVALRRVISGETTLQEVERVVGGREEDAPPPVPATVGREPEPEPVPQGPTVLVVDDDPIERRVARAVLEKAGYVVVEADNGRKALERFRDKYRITAVVTDLMMHPIDGGELLRTIRSSIDANLPIVVLTSSDDAEIEAQLLDDGATDYLHKPIDAARFLARVKAAMRRMGAEVPA